MTLGNLQHYLSITTHRYPPAIYIICYIVTMVKLSDLSPGQRDAQSMLDSGLEYSSDIKTSLVMIMTPEVDSLLQRTFTNLPPSSQDTLDSARGHVVTSNEDLYQWPQRQSYLSCKFLMYKSLNQVSIILDLRISQGNLVEWHPWIIKENKS